MGNGENSTAFDLWNPTELRPEILSIAVVFLILTTFILCYYFKIRKLDPKEAPKGITFFIFNIINSFKNLVFEVAGPSFVKFTPYILTIFLYIAGCNMVSLIGFENPTATTTVTFSMGFITVIGSLCAAIRYQKSRFFLRFLFKFNYVSKKTGKQHLIPYFFNPFGILDFVTPLLSISLRLWGNIFAGALIMSLIYALPMVFFGHNPLIQDSGPEIILFSIVAVPFQGFFDFMIGIIQAYVFVVLTLSYWGNEATSDLVDEKLFIRDAKASQLGFDRWEENAIKVELKNIGEIIE